MKKILEVCVDSVESAIAAEKGGADRLELCANLIIGGTTPSPALYHEIRRYTNLPVRVLIRPRFGDFCYSKHEFSIVRDEVAMYAGLGADAIVVGCLEPNGAIAMEQMRQLIDIADGMEFTFHRAFDMCKDPFAALEQVKELGIGTILTSGQRSSYEEGSELLSELIARAGEQVTIMPGGGVSPETLLRMDDVLHARAYHMSGKIVQQSRMTYRREGVGMGLPTFSEFEIWQTAEDKVRRARRVLDNEF